MKCHTVQLLALTSVASAIPHPQLPAFSMPSFSLPTGGFGTGTGTGAGLGSGFSFPTNIPSFGLGTGSGGFSLPTNIPSFGSGGASGTGGSSWGDWLSGLGGDGGGLGGGAATSTAAAAPITATATDIAAAPTSTGATGTGTVGANCTPQKAGSSTENGVKDKTCCTDLTLIFARGTGELGNMGTISGPPMVKAIRSKLGVDRVTVQGVDYAASAAGNANLGGDGGQTMADLVKAAKAQCPDSKIIMSGYSQGAMVVHNAFSKGVTASDVAGTVMFGDPLKRQGISGLGTDKVKEFCGTSDQICGGGGDGGATGSHLSYGSSAEAAATFVIKAAGLA
jgi:cutinase